MKNRLKTFLKKYFLILKIKERFSPTVQIEQRALYLKHRENASKGFYPKIHETGFRIFSQFEEDGLLLYLFSLIGMTNKTFLEIGADDGLNSNCANFYFNFGWRGTFIDGNSKAIERGKRFYSRYPHEWNYQPTFVSSKVNAENINDLVKNSGLNGEIGLMSIDIDGNDYWVWKALEVVEPQVVIIETHNEFGLENIVVPYDPDYFYPGKHPLYHGASPKAMTKLASEKGYRLVGANDLGFNFIFLKEGLIPESQLPTVAPADLLGHPSAKEGMKGFQEIKDWEYVRP